jgi:predicted nucleic acid-binding Zn ribbon protein
MMESSDPSATTICPKCAEPAPADAVVCDCCAETLRRTNPQADRLAEVASLAIALIVIVVVCRLIGRALGL